MFSPRRVSSAPKWLSAFVNTKGKLGTRTIPIIQELRLLLEPYSHPEHPYLFPSRQLNHHWKHASPEVASHIMSGRATAIFVGAREPTIPANNWPSQKPAPTGILWLLIDRTWYNLFQEACEKVGIIGASTQSLRRSPDSHEQCTYPIADYSRNQRSPQLRTVAEIFRSAARPSTRGRLSTLYAFLCQETMNSELELAQLLKLWHSKTGTAKWHKKNPIFWAKLQDYYSFISFYHFYKQLALRFCRFHKLLRLLSNHL